MKIKSVLLTVLTGWIVSLALAQAGWDPRKADAEATTSADTQKAQEAVDAFLEKDPTMEVYFEQAYGFAIFPGVGKGGFGIGGAHGKGQVYEQGKLIGTARLTQITIGFQLGGQKFREVIFFKNKAAIDEFKQGNFKFSAQASAVAVTAGAGAKADYNDDVAVFTLTKGGLMYEASIGGQKFSFKPTQ